MTIYTCLIFAILFLGFIFLNQVKNKKYFLYSSFFLMFLVLALRGRNVGEDTNHYIFVFSIIRNLSWETVLTSLNGVVWDSLWGQSVEIGYGILNKLIGVFTSEGQVLIAVVAALTCWLFSRFIYRNLPEHVFIATIVILCDSLFMGAFNGIRQMLALAIVVNAYEYTQQKKIKMSLFVLLLGFFVHNSAIAIIPFLLLSQVKNKKAGVRYTIIGVATLLCSVPLLMIIVSRLLPRYAVYFSINYWEVNSLRGTLILWLFEIVMAVYLVCRKKITQDEYIGIIGLIMYITVEIMGQEIAAVGRLSYYYRFFTVFLFASFGKYLEKKSRYIYNGAFFFFMVMEYLSFARTPARLYEFFF